MPEVNKTPEVKKIDFPFSCSGNEIDYKQELYIDEDGYKRKRRSQEYNIRELIESQASSNTLARVKAAVMAVSPNGANVNPALLDGIDLSLYPQSMAEMFERMEGYKIKYNSLDPFTKSLFTDADDFVKSIVNGTIKDRLDAGVEAKIKETKEAAAAAAAVEGGQQK